MAPDFVLTDERRAVIGVESDPWPVEVTNAFDQVSVHGPIARRRQSMDRLTR